MREVLHHDKRSITEIMAEEKFAEGGQVKPVTLDFEYEGKPVSITFTPESGEFKTHYDSDNPDVRFHIDYDEDYGSISVAVYPDEDSEEEIVFRQDIKPEDNMFYFKKGGQLNTEIQKIVDAMTDKEVAEKVTNLIFSSLDSLEGDMTASEAYDYALENIEDAREHLVELADAMDLKDELK